MKKRIVHVYGKIPIKIYRNTCRILVLMATLYGCLTIRTRRSINQGVLPRAPVVTARNGSTVFQTYGSHIGSNSGGQVSSSLYADVNSRVQSKDSSNIKTYRKYSNADWSDTRGKENITPNSYVNIDKAVTLEQEMEANTLRKQNVLTNRKIILIVAYMRTGSTLIGSLFETYPGTFYVFEPIRLLDWAFRGLTKNNETYVTLKYVHGIERNYSAKEKNKVILDELNNWLNCKLESISIRSLTNCHHRWHTKVMRTFSKCTEGHLGSYITHADKSLKLCFKTAINSCEKAPLRAIKEIRLSMEEATKLLPFYPNMKIIHIVRDPRGILNSRLKIHEVENKTFKNDVRIHCKRVEKDLKISKEMMKKHSKRVKIVHYEDLAERPIETVRALVKFAELPFDKSTQNFIQQQTNASRDSGAHTTERKNSSRTANAWRSQMDPEKAHFIFDMCKTSNSVLGYLPLASAQSLKNQTLPSRQLLDVVGIDNYF